MVRRFKTNQTLLTEYQGPHKVADQEQVLLYQLTILCQTIAYDTYLYRHRMTESEARRFMATVWRVRVLIDCLLNPTLSRL